MIFIKGDKSDGSNAKWIVLVTSITFITSMFLSYVAAEVSAKLSWYFAVAVLFFIILMGIIFDMLGMAIATADETPFHALASKKVKGAKQAIKLLRNAEKMSSFCNDVIGDIAGIISGSTSAAIVVYVVAILKLDEGNMLVSMLVTALTAAITVGGKAAGKKIAINNANSIVLMFSKILCLFSFEKRSRK